MPLPFYSLPTCDAILFLPQGGGHKLVKLGILGKMILEGYNGAADADKPAPCWCVGDVTELGV